MLGPGVVDALWASLGNERAHKFQGSSQPLKSRSCSITSSLPAQSSLRSVSLPPVFPTPLHSSKSTDPKKVAPRSACQTDRKQRRQL